MGSNPVIDAELQQLWSQFQSQLNQIGYSACELRIMQLYAFNSRNPEYEAPDPVDSSEPIQSQKDKHKTWKRGRQSFFSDRRPRIR